MLDTLRLASYRPSGQGEVGYEAAKGDGYRPDCYLYHRHSHPPFFIRRSVCEPNVLLIILLP